MSAMPERELWWLNPEEDGTAVVVGFDPGASYPLAVKLVPESALLAAEARVRELEQIHRDEMDLHDEMEAKLAAERDALVPLARYALNWCADDPAPSPEQRAAARAILDRRDREAK